MSLLAPDEPPPVAVERFGDAMLLVTCDHAGRRVPRALADLGLPEAELSRHIGWDIGALPVARMLAEQLGGTLIAQAYSRLAIDCNRRPGHRASIPPVSDGTHVPGNAALSAADAAARRTAIFDPYHAAIARALDEAQARGERTRVIAMHSFTPVFGGIARPMHAGILFGREPGFALAVGAALRREAGLVVADNAPYALSDEDDYTIPVHAVGRGLPYVELEVRQDLIADDAGQAAWGNRLVAAIKAALHEH